MCHGMARLIFLDGGFVPDFDTGPQSHVEVVFSLAAPCHCVASCAGIGKVSRGLDKPVFFELSVLPQCEVNLSGEGRRCKKMVSPTAIRA